MSMTSGKPYQPLGLDISCSRGMVDALNLLCRFRYAKKQERIVYEVDMFAPSTPLSEPESASESDHDYPEEPEHEKGGL